jgi:hypothetical protein
LVFLEILDHITALEQGNETFRTGLNTLGGAITEVTLHGLSAIRIVIYAAIRADERTEPAAQALGLVRPNDAAVRILCNSPGRAALFTSRFPALIAGHGSMESQFRQMHRFDPGAARIRVPTLTFFLAQKAVCRTNGIFNLECIMKGFHCCMSPGIWLNRSVTLQCHCEESKATRLRAVALRRASVAISLTL